MIGVSLMGGLGNQMFQYALGRKMALKHKTSLVLDLNFYNNQADVDTPRHYELDCFSLKPRLATKPLASKKPLFAFSSVPYFANVYTEKHFQFDPEVFAQPNDTLYKGYWQTPRYFDDIRDTLSVDFTLANKISHSDEAVLSEIKMQPSVSLHVRRGDYVSNSNANKFHGLKGLDYYSAALKTISATVPHFKLFVFSDDIDWCKDNISSLYNDIFYVDGERDGCIDMHLMKHCNHNIIANSSFSWWAAWLNQNSDKIVVAPSNWFSDQNTDTSDIIPEQWHQI